MNLYIKKYKGKILLLLLSLLYSLFVIIFYICKINKFIHILPKVSLNNNKTILKDIFKSRKLYINGNNITNDYICFIRSINRKYHRRYHRRYKYKELVEEIKFNNSYFMKRKNQLNFKQYIEFCMDEKIINYTNIKYREDPYISVIIPVFNKKNSLIRSIKSIQSQTLKNIEIIIIDDCSTDNTNKYYKNLLEYDSRIRIFFHLKNMGVWRTRIDGFLYSRGKYVIHFDAGDLYEDNYVLEDAYNIIIKYNLDSVKMLFRCIYDFKNLNNYKIPIRIKTTYTKIAYEPNIEKYNKQYFKNFGNIWTRLTRNAIISKGLSSLSNRLLNIYKNFWEDIWWNKIIDKESHSLLIINRYSYLYYKDGKGEGDFKFKTELQKDRMIHEFLYFLYFDLELLPPNNNKKNIIKQLHKYNNIKNKINLSYFKTKYYILDDLLNILLKDSFVSNDDKIFLHNLLNISKIKQNQTII